MSLTKQPLGEVVDFAYGKGLPARHRNEGSFLVYGSAGVVGSHDRALVKGPGIIVGRKGTVGAVHWCNTDFYPIDTTYYVIPKDEKISLRYAYYLLKTLPLSQMNTDVAVPGLNRNNALRLKVSVPAFAQQERVIDILSAYDDLIENNRRRIQLLERGAARLLYKEWFVNLRFPGHEHVRIKDGVPEGWEKRRLCDIADITMGQSPKSEYYNQHGDGLPFHQGVTHYGVRFPTHKIFCTFKSRIAEEGDILFSVRAPVGRINITLDKIVIGRGLSAIKSAKRQQNFLFYALKDHFFKEDMIGGGAIFTAITKKNLHEVELLQPPDRLVELFLDHVIPIDQQIENLHRSSNRLIKARDILLPRLMNGELQV